MARDYELGMIINPEAGDDQARAIVERVTTIVANNGGTVVRVNAWGRRHMAYPIERHRDGLYFWFDLMLPPHTVAELERTLRVNEEIIRHLVKARDPRAVAQSRQREAEADAHAAAQAAAQAAQAAQAAEGAVAQAATSAAEEVAAAAEETTAAEEAVAVNEAPVTPGEAERDETAAEADDAADESEVANSGAEVEA